MKDVEALQMTGVQRGILIKTRWLAMAAYRKIMTFPHFIQKRGRKSIPLGHGTPKIRAPSVAEKDVCWRLYAHSIVLREEGTSLVHLAYSYKQLVSLSQFA